VARAAVGASGIWLLSCLPVALPALWAPAEASLGDASRLALAALPWLAWIGIPGGGGASWSTAALAAPPLAAALTVDRAHGRPLAGLAVVAVASLVMIGLLAAAGRRTAGAGENGPRARLAAVAWMLLVPGLPLLRSALESGGAPSFGAAPRWLAALADASPIAWAWQCARSGVSDRGSLPWAALAVCVGLLAIRGFAPPVVEGVVSREAAS
jgi:hypothetical protein